MGEHDSLLKELEGYLNEKLSPVIVDDKQVSLDAGCCFTVSKIATGVLRRLGYECHVQRVELVVDNEIAREAVERHDVKDVNWQAVYQRGGYTVGMGMEGRGHYHYVVFFPKRDEVMDLTFRQASRPQRNIVCEPYWQGVDNLPKRITYMKFVGNDNEWERQTLYYDEAFKQYGKEVIAEGFRRLKWKYSLLSARKHSQEDQGQVKDEM